MSGLLLKQLSASEIEFIAEETLITVTSSVDHPVFNFISGDFGPLIAGMPCELPLWLAIYLKKKGKCKIQIPDWLSVATLEIYVAHERTESTFYSVPFHYIEIALLLINHAKEDIKMVDKVSALVKDLENIRMDRAKLGLLDVADRVGSGQAVQSIGLTNIACGEIQALKAVFIESMNVFKTLTDTPTESSTSLNRSTISTSNLNTQDSSNQSQVEETINNTTSNLRRFRRNN